MLRLIGPRLSNYSKSFFYLLPYSSIYNLPKNLQISTDDDDATAAAALLTPPPDHGHRML